MDSAVIVGLLATALAANKTNSTTHTNATTNSTGTSSGHANSSGHHTSVSSNAAPHFGSASVAFVLGGVAALLI